jgi:hypothetical protein
LLKIAIGWDPREAVAYHVLCHSILRQASGPVSFIPINKANIPEFTRGMEDGSTEFSFSRFLTPWLCGYEGQAIFMDCDMLVMCDIYELLAFNDDHAVSCVKHVYTPTTGKKFNGNFQHIYPKKNWSSLMVLQNARCKALTPRRVNIGSSSYLHQMEWADSIGEIPKAYNHLVGEYKPAAAKIAHFTLGTPCFEGYEDQEYADRWFAEKELMLD